MSDKIIEIAELLEEAFLTYFALSNDRFVEDEDWNKLTRLCFEIKPITISIVYRAKKPSNRYDNITCFFENLLIKPYKKDIERVDKEFWDRMNKGDKLPLSKQDSALFTLCNICDDIIREVNSIKKEEDARIQKINQIKRWVYDDKVDCFIRIEEELINRKFINEDEGVLLWKNYINYLLDLICILNNYSFFRPKVQGIHKIKDHHYRQFIAERYGFGKTGLTDMAQKHKPTLSQAEATFWWIKEMISN